MNILATCDILRKIRVETNPPTPYQHKNIKWGRTKVFDTEIVRHGNCSTISLFVRLGFVGQLSSVSDNFRVGQLPASGLLARIFDFFPSLTTFFSSYRFDAYIWHTTGETTQQVLTENVLKSLVPLFPYEPEWPKKGTQSRVAKSCGSDFRFFFQVWRRFTRVPQLKRTTYRLRCCLAS